MKPRIGQEQGQGLVPPQRLVPPEAGWSQRKVTGIGWLFVLMAAIGIPYATLKYTTPETRRNHKR